MNEDWPRPLRAWWSADVLALAVVLSAALVLRVNAFLLIPPFTDETREILRALAIGQDGFWPLTNYESYMGALANYLFAALFALFGPQLALPRLVMVLAGTATVGITYVLARAQRSHPEAALAALLLATCAPHFLLVSRVAWSSHFGPLLATAALLMFAHFQRTGGVAWLASGALAAGLALQTHPTIAPLLPGMVLALAVRPPPRSPSPTGLLLASAFLVLGCSNLLLANLLTHWDGLRDASRLHYVVEPTLAPLTYLTRLGTAVVVLARSLTSSFDTALADRTALPILAIALIALLVGAVACLRERHLLLLGPLASSLLLLPVVLHRFEYLPSDAVRYLAPLWPPAFILIARGFGEGWRAATRWPRVGRLEPMLGAGVTALALLMVLWPAQAGLDYQQRALERRASNQGLLEASQALLAAAAGRPIWVDRRLENILIDDGGGRVKSALLFTLTLQGHPPRVLDLEHQPVAAAACLGDLDNAVVALHPTTRKRLAPAWQLVGLNAGSTALSPSPIPSPVPLWQNERLIFLGRLRHAAERPALQVPFQEAVALVNLELREEPQRLVAVLTWVRFAEVEADLQRELELVAADGTVLAHLAGQPGGRSCPLKAWPRHQMVPEVVTLTWPAIARPHLLRLGWRDPARPLSTADLWSVPVAMELPRS